MKYYAPSALFLTNSLIKKIAIPIINKITAKLNWPAKDPNSSIHIFIISTPFDKLTAEPFVIL